MLNRKVLISVLMINLFAQPLQCLAAEPPTDLVPSPTLKILKQIKVQDGLTYSRLSWKGATVHCMTVETKKNKYLKFTPYMSEKIKEPSLQIFDADAIVAVNGGFFNLSDGESTSYITINEKSMCEPKENKALIENPKLKAFLPQIFDRSEIRFLRTESKKSVVQIVRHSEPVPKGMKLEGALQGGPQLLPQLTSEKEAFVRKDANGKFADSIGTAMKAARTAIGITSDGIVKILCAEGGKKAEFAQGVSLKDLAELFKKLGCTQALNLDGGTSTTMVVNLEYVRNEKLKDKLDTAGHVGPPSPGSGAPLPEGMKELRGARVLCPGTPERKVKSILCVVESVPE